MLNVKGEMLMSVSGALFKNFKV